MMMRRLLLCFCLLLPAMTVSAKDSVVGSPRIHAVQNGVVVTDTMVVRDGDELYSLPSTTTDCCCQ